MHLKGQLNINYLPNKSSLARSKQAADYHIIIKTISEVRDPRPLVIQPSLGFSETRTTLSVSEAQ